MYRRFLRAGIVLGLIIVGMPVAAYAQYTSPNYKVEEIFIGGGSQQGACSGNQFCADQAAGGTAVGNTKSDNFGAQAGSQTSGDPTLTFTISNNDIDLGVLTDSSTAAASANFSVSTYLSSGYVVQVYGDAPTNSSGAGHTLAALASPNPSTPGTEQFGINLVANSDPGIGTNPVQVPSGDFSYGEAAPGYNTPDQFKYVNGDTIASSDTSSGQTDYTISIIANINSVTTPGGRYQGTLVLQIVATF